MTDMFILMQMGLCLVHQQYRNGPFIPGASLFFYLRGKVSGGTIIYKLKQMALAFLLLANSILIIETEI